MIRTIYIAIEIGFYLLFRCVLKPRANDLSKKKVHQFRDYPHTLHEPDSHRNQHFKRIVSRIKSTSAHYGTSFQRDFDEFIRGWFSFNERSGNAGSSRPFHPEENGIADPPVIDFDSVKTFFAWAFFEKRFEELQPWEVCEIDNMMEILKVEYGIVLPVKDPVHSRGIHPRRCTLESSTAFHRPLVVYFVFGIIRIFGYAILYILFGYRRYEVNYNSGTRTSAFSYWYRDGTVEGQSPCKTPVLFFHGIAPGGFTFYLPFLEHCFPSKQRGKSGPPVFLFETLPITYHFSFDVHSEEETVFGVEQALKRHGFGGDDCKLTLFGHSFGSFQLTWMLKAKRLRPKIQKLVLLDSVSILLSSPEVLLNFLYNGGEDPCKNDWATCWNRAKIRYIASSELFVEHYLRRGFAWFNSELWIEDIPKQVETHIFLSEADVILDAKKIAKELEMHCKSRNTLRYTIWKGHSHGDVLTRPHLWHDVSSALNSRLKKE